MIERVWDIVDALMAVVLGIGLAGFCLFIIGYTIIGVADLIAAMFGLGRYRLRDQRARHNKAVLHSVELEKELGMDSTEAQMRHDYNTYWEGKEAK